MTAHNTFFKKSYTQQEINECLDWFRQRLDRLPPSLNFGPIQSPDLPRTVRRMVTVLHHQMNDKGVYNGQFALLLQIRQLLQESGVE